MPETALQTAMKGGKVSDRQAKSALGQAVERIAGLTKRAKESKDAMVATGAKVVHTAETQGSLFLASLAEGYFGPDKLKVGSVDLRAPVGLVAIGYGLYETMTGGDGGGHALALGNGVTGSWLASVATQAGRTLAEKKGQGPATLTPAATLPAVQGAMPALTGSTGIPQPTLVSGPVREVLLTPPPAVEGADDVGRGGGRRRRGGLGRRRPGRFVRASADPDDEA